jgi:hypothetical protein
MATEERTDFQLEGMFTEPGEWVVRGQGAVSAPQKNLQSALLLAHQTMASNQIVLDIIKADGSITIDRDQMHRLLKKFRFTFT